MPTIGTAGRVGATVTLAGGLLLGIFSFYHSFAHDTYPIDVLFDDASGAAKDIPVTLAGVNIGKVKEVRLRGQQADVSLLLNDDIHIPTGSKFSITSPVLGGPGSIVVTPPTDASSASGTISAGSTVRGEHAFNMSTALNQSQDLLKSLTRVTNKAEIIMDSVQKITGDSRVSESLINTACNLSLASQNGVLLTKKLNGVISQDNDLLVSMLSDSKESLHTSLANISATTDQVHQATVEDRPKLSKILDNVQDMTAAVASITAQTNKDFTNGHVTENISDTISALKSSTDHLNQIGANLEKITGDPATNSDLKQTIHNIRETTTQSALLLQRLNHLAGTKNVPPVDIAPGPDAPTDNLKVRNAGASFIDSSQPASTQSPDVADHPRHISFLPRADFQQNTTADHFRINAGTFVSLGGPASSFGYAGIDGLGDTNNLNLQYGQGFGRGFDYRAGLYNSKLSVGADFGLTGRTTLSVTAYDPNRYKLDARGVIMLNKDIGLLAGADDITHKADGIVGTEMRW